MFDSLGPCFIAGGDYNAKHPQWGSRLTNSRGRALNDIIQTSNHQFHSQPNPTHWPSDPSKIPDILDFFVSSGLGDIHTTVISLDDLSSDHSPLLLTLNTEPQLVPPKPSLTPGPINWPKFQSSVENSLNLRIPLKSHEDVDEAVLAFTKAIQDSAINACVPSSRPPSPFPHSTPPHIQDLLLSKRRARRQWQRYRNPADKTTFNRLTKQLNRELISYKSEAYNDYLSSLTTRDNSLWTATKRILKFQPTASPIQRVDGSWARGDKEKSDLFASHLQSTFSPNPDTNPEHTAWVLAALDEPLPMSPPPKAFNPSEIKYIINHLPLRKAPGPDLITARILKNLSRKAIVFLTYIYNSILRTTYFPSQWKHSAIILIPKPNKPSTSASSYRPISLLPVLSKIFEKLLFKRIFPIVESQDVIPDHQFGFRVKHSTTQQTFRLVDTISSALERKEYCAGVFLDIAQAFDRVWHPGLLFKLKKFLPSTYYLILKSYLSQRSFHVQCGSSKSLSHPIFAGVPQGSILGPLLYTIFTSDLPSNPLTWSTTFADDTAILSTSSAAEVVSENLQAHLFQIEEWLSKWKIKVNNEKCVHVTFTLRRQDCPPVMLNSTTIPQANEVRYLGFYLDRRLTWNLHIRLKRQELNKRYGLLRRILGPDSKLTTENKLTIYKTIIRPIWTYGIELWGTAKPSNLHRIQSFQSKVLRRILNAPFYVTNSIIHNDLKFPTVSELAKTRFSTFHSKLSSHPNPLCGPLSSNAHPLNPPRRLKRQWPRDLL